jgi:molybdopterin molybdotransferase
MRNPEIADLITVESALEIILQCALDMGTEEVALSRALGRVLAEPLTADRPFPPFDRVTMDGIAIRHANFMDGARVFQIQAMQAAGQPPLTLLNDSSCIEIMTGAVLPLGTDTVIRYEDLLIQNGQATLTTEQIEPGQNIHFLGSNRNPGATIVPEGTLIGPGETGIAATVGKAFLKVKRLPQVAVISTGDELVEVHETPLPYQIRSSNVYSLSAGLQQMGLQPVRKHFPDDPQIIQAGLKESLEHFDAILITGGVSEGEFDFVPAALAALGVEKRFHKVRQRPGKPFWFGLYQQKCAVFAMPGNPVSAFMGTQQYFRPWLYHSLGLTAPTPVYAVLAEDFSFKPDLTYFLQVVLQYTPSGQLLAFPQAGGGSGDLANLANADAFMELPADKAHFLKGEAYPVLIYRRAF